MGMVSVNWRSRDRPRHLRIVEVAEAWSATTRITCIDTPQKHSDRADLEHELVSAQGLAGRAEADYLHTGGFEEQSSKLARGSRSMA